MTQKKAGVLLNYVLTFVHILSGIIYVPLLLSFLPAGDYGVYKLIGSLIGMLSILDFGLSNTVVRYYSMAEKNGDNKQQENVLAVCLIIFLIITGILILIGIGAYFLISPAFKGSLSPFELKLAKIIYLILFLSLAISIPTKIFYAGIFAKEKFVFVKLLQVFQGVLTPVCVLLALLSSPSVIYVVIIQTISNLLGIILTIFYALKKCKIKIKLHNWNKPLVKEIFIFSSFIFLAMIVDQIYWRCDSIIIGANLGSISVAIYSISSSLTDYFKQFGFSIGNVFMPELSRLELANESIKKMDDIFRKTGRLQSVVLFLILSGFVLFGFEFISIWTSSSIYNFSVSDKNLIYYITLAILVPLFIPSIESTGISILQAKNKHKFRSIVYLIIALLNVAFSVIFVRILGIWGCVIATSASLIIGQGIIMNIYYARLGLNIKKFFKQIIKMLNPLFFFSLLCYFINIKLKTSSFLVLGGKILIYCVIFAIITFFVSFNDYEKNLIKGLFKKNGLQHTNEKPNSKSC